MRRYITQQGDTLARIGLQLQVDLLQLCRMNPQIAANHPLAAGQIITIPDHDSPPLQILTPVMPPPPGYCTDTLLPPAFTFPEWVPLTPLSQMEQTDYDILIVGAGAGGSAVLRRLCERMGSRRLKIGIIERGKLLLPSHALNVPTLWNWDRMQRYYQNPTVTVPAGRQWPEFPGAILVFALGGRTLFWGLTCVRIPSFEFANWPISYKELEPYYKIAETVLLVNDAKSPINDQLLERLWLSGYIGASDVPEAVARGRIPRYMSAIEFIGEALRTAAFDMAVQARAVKVMTNEGRVTGVQVMDANKRSYVLKASTVVVSGSTFETPRLLLNSGIPGRAIGHYLSNHSYIKAEMPSGVPAGREGSINIIVPQTESRPYQFKILGNRDLVTYDVAGIVENRFDNYVYLDERRRDNFGIPELQVRFSYSPADEQVMREMVHALHDVSAAMRIQDPWHYCFWPPGIDNHDYGTCRMGNDPNTSATDRNGRIHGIEGLYISDASVFPSLGASNPLLTNVALSTRLADHLLKL
ncbi:GMC oxidoreductase [Paenibacillus kobensis]|uniref:GMC oxidoreductase n=1 Tax=Paenibacillus kobensis TaxID=59841 RepID=UPI0013E35763|nr:GMC family oxidoreductase [Paenibacillus kobensis]